MKHQVILLVLIPVLVFTACDNSPEPEPYEPGMEVELFAKWIAPNTVQLSASFFASTGYDLQVAEGFVEAAIYQGPSTSGPWELVGQRTIGREEFGSYLTFDVKVDSPEELSFFRLEARHLNDGILWDSFSGPVIATMHPAVNRTSWTVLPDLVSPTGISSSTMESMRFFPTALSPSGDEICVFDDRIRVFDAHSGTLLRSNDYKGSNIVDDGLCFWGGTSIAVLSYYDHLIVSADTLSNYWGRSMNWIFRRTDTSFVRVSGSMFWYSYSMVERREVRINPMFDIGVRYDNDWRSMALRPSGDELVARYSSEDTDFGDVWHLYTPATEADRLITILSQDGLNFTRNIPPWHLLDLHRLLYKQATWLTNDVVLLHTLWSGRREFWLYNVESGTCKQLTGYDDSIYPHFASSSSFSGIPPMPVPHYDKARNRLLFFFLVNENCYAVRSITPPI